MTKLPDGMQHGRYTTHVMDVLSKEVRPAIRKMNARLAATIPTPISFGKPTLHFCERLYNFSSPYKYDQVLNAVVDYVTERNIVYAPNNKVYAIPVDDIEVQVMTVFYPEDFPEHGLRGIKKLKLISVTRKT